MFEIWSSPLTTCVIFMKLSSTTTARLYKGFPISYPLALLDKTKSPPKSFPCQFISPLIWSIQLICIFSSILNLITEVLPWDMNVSISSFERFLCLLSCFGGNPLFFCSSLNSDISSSDVKHLYAAPPVSYTHLTLPTIAIV